MQFLPELATYLKEQGYIYTVRKFRYALSREYIQVEGVGRCERSRIAAINQEMDLIPYVERSGFQSTKDWWKKIRELNRGYSGPYYLHEVSVEEPY